MLSNETRQAIRVIRESLSKAERLDAAIELLTCDVGEDNDGQILLYTDLMYDADNNVTSFEVEE